MTAGGKRGRRAQARPSVSPEIEPHRAQHLSLAEAPRNLARGALFDEAESPLLWLARRKGADGRALIAPHQLQAGERLRADFTFAHMMPRTTANWQSPVGGSGQGGQGFMHVSDTIIAARQRMRQALEAVGPEFAGLLLDVCCFLKRLDAVEQERQWPARSAKVVLQLALDRLARHYGYQAEARGKAKAPIRSWTADDGSMPAGEGA